MEEEGRDSTYLSSSSFFSDPSSCIFEKKLDDESYVESLPSSSTRDFEYQYLSEQNDFSPVNEVEKIYSNEDEKISEVFLLIHYAKLNK